MKALAKCCVLLTLWVVAASSASAVTGYVHQPPFTPQRSMFWNFGTESWQTPATTGGPAWDASGTNDGVTYSSNLQWFDTDSHWSGHQGMIGLANDTDADQTVWINFHTRNFGAARKLWYEGALVTWGSFVGSVEGRMPNNCSYGATEGYYDDLTPGQRMAELWEFSPSPAWAEMLWQATIPAHGGVLIDYVYVSTEAVPEPSALMALGSGFMGILGLVWKRRK